MHEVHVLDIGVGLQQLGDLARVNFLDCLADHLDAGVRDQRVHVLRTHRYALVLRMDHGRDTLATLFRHIHKCQNKYHYQHDTQQYTNHRFDVSHTGLHNYFQSDKIKNNTYFEIGGFDKKINIELLKARRPDILSQSLRLSSPQSSFSRMVA